MAKINLLPWREEYRQTKKREFLEIAVVVLVVGLLTSFLWGQVIDARIDNQTSRNQLLESEIAALEMKVKEIQDLKRKKQEMLDRMAVIQALQANRPDIVRIFDELVKATPEGVYLSEWQRVDDNVSITGFAESNNRVSALMRNLDGSYKFTEPNLTKVEADPTLGEQGNKFEMRVQLTKPEVVVEQDKTGA
ncbi:MAG: pilus assembly protein PilN [Gammaproteobacteria bacterium BRH_c0]|nr:MAG: pilus assembly protein PilN [Gammaproteobacteria bacterium BRH_c0]